jgi:sulfur transfer complex TusBCD TusB component (DsrH family)
MAKRILSIVTTAYRATLEEQDDTILWLSHALKGAGADLDVLLRGNAVNYAVRGQDASGLAFGQHRQTEPPRLDEDVARLAAKGVTVFVVGDDLRERGIGRDDVVSVVQEIARAEIASLLDRYDQVWSW